MIIAVASSNKIKLGAVEESLRKFRQFDDVDILPIEVASDVAEQPVYMQEAIDGAKNRARKAYEGVSAATLGIGIESGIAQVSFHDATYYVTTVCAMFDGKEYSVGFSSMFALPRDLSDCIIEQAVTMGCAMKELGWTAKDELGKSEGTVGVLTHGSMSRQTYLAQSVFAALIPRVSNEYYER